MGKKTRKQIKKRYVVYLLGICYLLFNYSCLTMRTSRSKTQSFFVSRNIPFTDTTLKIGESRLRYIETGNKTAPNLVFIHGSPGSWDAWKGYLSDSTLLRRFRLIAPDRPGFGYSDFRKSRALAPQAALLNGLLEGLDNGKPITLIGHSYGGPLIVKMALEQPELYQNLMILAGSLDPDAEKPEIWRKAFMRFPLKLLVPGSFRPSNDELWMLKEDLIDLQPQLEKLTQNVMVIHGTKDRLVPYQNVPFMEKAFTHVDSLEVVRLENERHFIVWDREELIKEKLLEFGNPQG